MQIPINTFKQALRQGKPQIGLWLGLAWPTPMPPRPWRAPDLTGC